MRLSSLCDLCDPGKSNEEAIKIVRVKNLFQKMPVKSGLNDCLPTGYRHVLITIKFHDGFLAGEHVNFFVYLVYVLGLTLSRFGYTEIQLQLAQMFDVLGQDGYELHKEITKMDTTRSKVLVPHFNRYPYDGSLKTILCRAFNSLGQANKTTGGENSELIGTPSPSVLAIEGINEVSTTKGVSSREEQTTSREESHEDIKVDDDNSMPSPPTFLGGGGIAAAAAAAAQARNKEKPPNDDSNEEAKDDDGDARPSPPPFLGWRRNRCGCSSCRTSSKQRKASE